MSAEKRSTSIGGHSFGSLRLREGRRLDRMTAMDATLADLAGDSRMVAAIDLRDVLGSGLVRPRLVEAKLH